MLLSKMETCLLISPTSLAQSGIDPHKYLLIWRTWRWWPRVHQINFYCYLGGHCFLFVVEPSITETACHCWIWPMGSLNRLHICPTSLAKLGRSHVKKFHTNIYFVQQRGESTPHQPEYHSLAGWFHITIEPDAYHEYSWLVRLVSPRYVL
jgi:hypothetical protein